MMKCVCVCKCACVYDVLLTSENVVCLLVGLAAPRPEAAARDGPLLRHRVVLALVALLVLRVLRRHALLLGRRGLVLLTLRLLLLLVVVVVGTVVLVVHVHGNNLNVATATVATATTTTMLLLLLLGLVVVIAAVLLRLTPLLLLATTIATSLVRGVHPHTAMLLLLLLGLHVLGLHGGRLLLLLTPLTLTLLLVLVVLVLAIAAKVAAILGTATTATSGPAVVSVVVIDGAALVRALGLGGIPLEVALAHQVLHGVAAAALAVEAALADAGAVAEDVALVLGEARLVEVMVAGHCVLFFLLFLCVYE